MNEAASDDRRVRRTRLAIFEAFRDLVLSQRYDEIRVADIIDKANVGRSTFYDHFKGKDDVLLLSIEPLFNILAEAATQSATRERMFFVLSHFWDQRALARIIFGPELFFKLSRKLTDMIEQRLNEDAGSDEGLPARLIATDLASSQLGTLKAWLGGDFACDAEALAAYLVNGARRPR